jgi:hypothetical protein
MPKPFGNYPRSIDDRRAEMDFARNLLLERIEAARGGNRTVSGEGWSAAQIAYHLHLAEVSVTRMLVKLLASGERIEIATEERLIAEWERLRELVGKRSTKAESPPRVVPAAAPEIDEVLRLLAESRRILVEVLAHTDAGSLDSIEAVHPLKPVGTLAGPSWLSMIAFHELRHCEQVSGGSNGNDAERESVRSTPVVNVKGRDSC